MKSPFSIWFFHILSPLVKQILTGLLRQGVNCVFRTMEGIAVIAHRGESKNRIFFRHNYYFRCVCTSFDPINICVKFFLHVNCIWWQKKFNYLHVFWIKANWIVGLRLEKTVKKVKSNNYDVWVEERYSIFHLISNSMI